MKIAILFLLASVACFAQANPSLIAHNVYTSTSSPGGLTCAYPNCTTTTGISTIACTPNCGLYIALTGSSAGYTSAPWQISDSLNNIWVLQISQNEDGDTITQIWACFGATTGASQTFSTKNVQGGPAMEIMQWANMASGPDGALGSPGVGATFTVGPITPTENNELILSCIGATSGASITTAGAGWTVLDTVPYGGGYSGVYAFGCAYQIQTTAASVSASWATGTANSAVIISSYSTANPAPLLTKTTSLPEGFVGSAYNTLYPAGANQLLTTGGGIGPYTWAVTTGMLNAGLSLAASGLLTGTPTTAGTETVKFTVTDAQSNTATTPSITITVASTLLSLGVSGGGLTCPAGTQGQAYAGCTLVFSGGTGSLALSYSIACCAYSSPSSAGAPLPPGMALNTSTGAITSSYIGAQGEWGVKFIVTDSVGASLSHFVLFSLAGANTCAQNIFPSNAIFYHRMDSLPADTSTLGQIPLEEQSETFKDINFGGSSNNPAFYGTWPAGFQINCVPYNQASQTIAAVPGGYQTYFSAAPIPSYISNEDTQNASPDGQNGCCDMHALIVQAAGGGNPPYLFEMFNFIAPGNPAYLGTGNYQNFSNAIWQTNTNAIPQNGSTDAIGMTITGIALTADDVIGSGTPTAPTGTISHVMRCEPGHMSAYYLWPATQADGGVGTCYATSGTGSPISRGQINQASPPNHCVWDGSAGANGTGAIMAGGIYRLKAGATGAPSCIGAGTCPQYSIIITGLQQFGCMIADNSGGDWSLDGTGDSRFVSADIANLASWPTMAQMELVNTSSLLVSNNSYQAGTGGGTLPGTPSCPTTTGTQYSAYSSNTSSSTGTTPITYSVSSGALPSGIYLTGSTGVIAGTPTGGGTNAFQLIGTNVAGNSITPASCTITISPLSPSIVGIGGIISVGTIH